MKTVGTIDVSGGDIDLPNNAVDEADISNSAVSNDKLAGSIADSKLSQITTADKVAGSAVQLSAQTAIENNTGLRLKSAIAGSGLALSAAQVLSVEVSGALKITGDKVGLSGSFAGTGLEYDGGVDSISSLSVELSDTGGLQHSAGGIEIVLNDEGGLELVEDGMGLKAAVAGDGLAHNLGVLSVSVDDSSIETNSDTLRIKAAGVTNAMLAGSIGNAKLANSSVTVTAGDGLSGGGSVSLGGTVSVAVQVDDSSIETSADTLRVKAGGVTNDMLAGSIDQAKLAGSIPDTKLNAISTANKVEASALELATNTAMEDDGGLCLKAGIAGDGLAIAESGGNQVLSVSVDDSSIETNSDALRIKAAGVTNAMLAGSIENAKLANSAMTIAGTSVSLGGSIAASVVAAAIDGENMAITGLTDLDVASAGNITILDTVGANTLTVGAAGTTVNIAGNLTVAGSTTTINTETVTIADHNLVLDSNNATSDVVNQAGITIEGGSGDDITFQYNSTSGNMELKKGSDVMTLIANISGASTETVQTISADATLNLGNGTIVLCNASSGNVTITLPAASGNSGKIVKFKRTDSSGNSVILDGNASETIDGEATVTMSSAFAALSLVCNGTAWFIM